MATSTKRSNQDSTALSDDFSSEYDTPTLALQEYEYASYRASAPLTNIRDWQMAQPNHVCNHFKVPDSRLLH